eukprot:SAG31_NODE_2412_length_5746_cov_5.160439_4_plen_551_part_00
MTPITWGFMLLLLVCFAVVDIAQNVRFVDREGDNSTAAMDGDVLHRRNLAATAGEDASEPLDLTESVNHVVLVGLFSWIALLVTLALLFFLRRRSRLLISRKFHLHGWAQQLVPLLKDGIRRLRERVLDAESHGHDHLQALHEFSMDGDLHGNSLREIYEGGAYSETVGRRCRGVAHCLQMWWCFSLSYYCMDLVVIVGQTQWSVATQILAHVLLLLPQFLSGMMLGPAVMKFESLLSAVVRPVDEVVATVMEHMNTTDRLIQVTRLKLVDAHRQHLEELSACESRETTSTASRIATVPEKIQANAQGWQVPPSPSHRRNNHTALSLELPRVPARALNFSEAEVDAAARWLFVKIADVPRGDEEWAEISLTRLRIGLHQCNMYFKEKDWKTMSRVLERASAKGCTNLRELLILLHPQSVETMHWRDSSGIQNDPDSPCHGPELESSLMHRDHIAEGVAPAEPVPASLAERGRTRSNSYADWVYEDIDQDVPDDEAEETRQGAQSSTRELSKDGDSTVETPSHDGSERIENSPGKHAVVLDVKIDETTPEP